MGIEEKFKAQLVQWKALERDALAAEARSRAIAPGDPDAEVAARLATQLRRKADDFLALILGGGSPSPTAPPSPQH